LNRSYEQSLRDQFEDWTGKSVQSFESLPQSGSNRKYFRLGNDSHTAIGVYNPIPAENQAFVGLAKHLIQFGVKVPKIYREAMHEHTYLQEDLGNKSLFEQVSQQRVAGEFPVDLYKKSLAQLVLFQVEASKSWDFDQCYPQRSFDRKGIMGDLQYFHYYFFRPAEVPYDEYQLVEAFESFADYLISAPSDYLMFRDFQARNIMLKEEEPYFIDFQGARQGPLQYDLASILFQAKAQIPHDKREELLDFYISELKKKQEVNEEAFKAYYYGFVLLRTLQVLGAYGFRGLFERKAHFLQSIPFALENLKWLLERQGPHQQIPYLQTCLSQLVAVADRWQAPEKAAPDSKLTVHINSFSFKKGWPEGHPEHGGGFVFDCRALHNPGRYAPYKALTGHDKSVQDFLQQESRVASFLEDIYRSVDPSVEKYLERGFDHLSISFGCTGGQHRSVYCAIKVTEHLRQKYGVKVELFHREQPQLN
jgi:aminoglycoside/choline kinase family phosphotransferase